MHLQQCEKENADLLSVKDNNIILQEYVACQRLKGCPSNYGALDTDFSIIILAAKILHIKIDA